MRLEFVMARRYSWRYKLTEAVLDLCQPATCTIWSASKVRSLYEAIKLTRKKDQWLLQVMFPSACSFIVFWFSLSFTTCFGPHGHLQVCRIFRIFSYA
jgi:hypothetical protein